MEEKKGKSALIVVLVILVLGMGGYIIYDKLLNKELPNNDIQTNNNITCKEEISVVEAINTKPLLASIEYGSSYILRVPRITGSTKTIKEINNKIMHKMLHDSHLRAYECDPVDEDVNGNGPTGKCHDNDYEFNYESLIKDNIVIINIYSDKISATKKSKESFIYDITEDKQLTIREAAQKLNIPVTEVDVHAEEQMDISSDELKAYVYVDL